MPVTNVTTQGFEGLVYYGVKGTTAATQILNSRDIKITLDPDMGNTTIRGDATLPPIDTECVSGLKWSMSLNAVNRTDDTTVAALKSAASQGIPVAIRMKDRSAGAGYDGDCNVKMDMGVPLKGEQTLDFTFTPNRDLRVPLLYS